MSSVVLDCWSPLPSTGLSVLARFKLGMADDQAVVAFTVANLQGPRIVPSHSLQRKSPVAAVVEHVRAAVHTQLLKVSASYQLASCIGTGSDRLCALLLLNRTSR